MERPKNSQQASSFRAAQIEQLFELSMDLLCIAGLDGYFKRVNPAFSRLLGYSEDELLSQPFVEFIHPEDRESVAAPMARLADGLTVIDFENRYQRRDGTYCWLAWRAQVSSSGEIFAVARDITERKRAEKEQEALRVQMLHAQKLESLGVLAGGIAHDFNNLLVGILGNSGLAQAEVEQGSRMEGFLNNIEMAATRAADLANQMLAYAGQSQMEFLPVDLNALIAELTELLRVSIGKNTEIQFNFAESLTAIKGDPTQLRQVVMNLITNAADAIGDEPGKIVLRTESPHYIERRSGLFLGQEHASGNFLLIKAEDNGCGMDGATMERMFDPFYSTKLTGHGLGLAAILGIVRAHGGFIEVESTVGEGTIFSIALPTPSGRPLVEACSPSIPDTADPRDLWRGSGKVLVVDDEVMVRHVAELILMELGFEVLTAPDGHSALEIYDLYKNEIDLVLLDLTMPVLDGEATLSALRERDAELRVILSTGFSGSRSEPSGSGPQADAYLPKPYSREELVKVLSKVFADSTS